MKPRTRSLGLAVSFLLVASVAYTLGRAPKGGAAIPSNATTAIGSTATPVDTPPGWRAHRSQVGYAVAVPPNWAVREDESPSGRVVTVRGPAGAEVIVWPVFTKAALRPATAAAVLRDLSAKLVPGAEWQAPQTSAATAVRMVGRVRDRVAVSAFSWVTSPIGSAGYAYVVAAPQARYPELEPTFTAILESFRLTGAPPPSGGARAAVKLDFVRWQDPLEAAFNLDVPAGWSVGGGTFRASPLDARFELVAASPDGRIRITGGDRDLPGFTEPLPGWEAYYPEGSWYPLRTGGQLFVRRYVPGEAFAQEHVRDKVSRVCGNVTVVETRDRADAVRAVNEIYARYAQALPPGYSRHLTAGEITFACTLGGEPARGYYYAATALSQGAGSRLWKVEALYGYVASSGEEGRAVAALTRMLQSARYNEEWLRMMGNVTAEAGRIASELNAYISGLIRDAYQARGGRAGTGEGRDPSAEWSEAMLGVTNLRDEATGNTFRVESGSNYYWVDPRGTVRGTETYTQPGVDFRELVRLPPT